MKNIILYIFLIGSLSLFYSCDEDNGIADLPFNENLLFQNSFELNISATPDSNDFPIFDISAVEHEKVFIAVSTEPLTSDNMNIENTGAIVWQWHSGMNSNNFIKYNDGQIMQPSLDFNGGLCCNGDEYFWTAWAWDETGEYIIASTENKNFNVTTPAPEIKLQQTVLHYESGGDGFAQKSEDITIRVFIRNTSTIKATNISGTFSHPLIAALPQTLSFGDLEPNETRYAELDFKVPDVSNDELNLDIEANFTFNGSLKHDTSFIQPVTLLPCVERITLEWTSVNLATMDQGAFPGEEPADLYMRIFGNNILLESTATTLNQTNDDLPFFWYYSPCGQYYLTETFTFRFMDYDTINQDDLIGDVDIVFGDYAAIQNYQPVIILQNSDVRVRLDVVWK